MLWGILGAILYFVLLLTLGLWTLRVDGHRIEPQLSTGYRLDQLVRRIGVQPS